MFLNNAILPGTLEERYNVCGKPNCRCKDKENPQKHGPYGKLSYNLKGKNSTVHVSKKNLALVKDLTDNYRTAKSYLENYALESVEYLKINGPEALVEHHNEKVRKEIVKLTGGVPDSQLLRTTTKSRDNWKEKAISRGVEKETHKKTIIDLKKSRENWKTKACIAQKELNKLEAENDIIIQENKALLREIDELKKKHK